MSADTRPGLTAERLALLNCRSDGETFTGEDREALTWLIQLAGDRLEELAQLEQDCEHLKEEILRGDRKLDAAELALAEARVALEATLILRKLVWLGHGCGFGALYGDDGEMQCNGPDCRIDFKRDSPQGIEARLIDRYRKALAQAKALAGDQP